MEHSKGCTHQHLELHVVCSCCGRSTAVAYASDEDTPWEQSVDEWVLMREDADKICGTKICDSVAQAASLYRVSARLRALAQAWGTVAPKK